MSDQTPDTFILGPDGEPLSFGLKMHTAEEMASAVATMGLDPSFTCAAPALVPVDNPMEWFLQQSQSIYPFCHAHGRTAVEEFLYWLATQGKVIQLSRAFASITDMRQDGNDKVPAGASIPGSIQASDRFGNVQEAKKPYFKTPKPGEIRNSSDMNRFTRANYSNEISDELLKEALQTRITKFTPCRSYEQMDAAMITGNFAVFLGITWTNGLASLRNVEFAPERVPSNGVLGGHALASFGWKTRAGERWYAMHNSHDGWGQKMRVYMSPRWWDQQMKSSQFGFYLCSDLLTPDQPRGWDWLDQANFSLSGKPIQWA